jgi:hypothetical protein
MALMNEHRKIAITGPHGPIKSRLGDAEPLQRTLDWQGRLLDQPDDLQPSASPTRKTISCQRLLSIAC